MVGGRIRKWFEAVKNRFVEPELMTHFEGRTTAKVPIEFSARAEQVRRECAETISWDAPVDEQGNIIVGDYSVLREPMDGVIQYSTPEEMASAHAADAAFEQALLDPSALIVHSDKGAPNGRPHSI